MTPDEATQRLRNCIRELSTQTAKVILIAASDMDASIQRRVRGSAIDDSGNPFGIYSAKTQAIKRRSGRKSASFPLINFEDTGRMWNNTKPTIISEDAHSAKVEIKPQQSGEQEKMIKNVERFGLIIRPNKDELADAKRAIKAGITKIINKYT